MATGSARLACSRTVRQRSLPSPQRQPTASADSSGRSALGINLAGALANHGHVAIVSFDSFNRSALDYASSGRLFTVTDPTRGPVASTGNIGRT